MHDVFKDWLYLKGVQHHLKVLDCGIIKANDLALKLCIRVERKWISLLLKELNIITQNLLGWGRCAIPRTKTQPLWGDFLSLYSRFYEVTIFENIYTIGVATLLWPCVGVKPNTWKKWGVGVLRDSPMFRARQQGPKHLAFWVFLVSLESSWSVDIENGLALAIWTSVAQVMGKRKVGSQTGSLTPDH